MKKVNVVIAKHERDDYLAICLHHLNVANELRRFTVNVYVVDDRENRNTLCYENIDVHLLYLHSQNKYFNKSRLLNHGLESMIDGFDWLSIIDVDMCYKSSFFTEIEAHMTKSTYIVCSGRLLTSRQTEEIRSEIQQLCFNMGPTYPGASQISMSRETYHLFKRVYDNKLYYEDFDGWGGEDSDLSLRSLDMKSVGIIDRIKISDMWLHMYHDSSRANRDVNYKLFEKRRTINRELLRRYMNDKSAYSNV